MNTPLVVTTQGLVRRRRRPHPVLMRRRTQEDHDARDFHAAMARACEGQKSGRLSALQDLVR